MFWNLEIVGSSHIVLQLASCDQEVSDKNKDVAEPWELCGLIPLFDPPRHDSAETIRRALYLGVNVKMITGTGMSPACYKIFCDLQG